MISKLVFAFGLLFVVICFGLRSLVHRRRTGDLGFRASRQAPALLFGLALIVLLGAPLLPLAPLWTPPLVQMLLGATLAMFGAGGTWWAQEQMGASWRIGVGPGERTALVTHGIYARVRNPIFTGVLATALGGVLVLPTAAMLAGLGLLWLAIELQVRRVEEPHLSRLHGGAYAEYCRRAGRFLPRW